MINYWIIEIIFLLTPDLVCHGFNWIYAAYIPYKNSRITEPENDICLECVMKYGSCNMYAKKCLSITKGVLTSKSNDLLSS